MMQRTISVNAVVWVALGIAFGLYGPLMLNLFGVPDVPSEDLLLYWNVAAFTRLYGAALFGLGLMLWAVRGFILKSSMEDRRGILFSLVLANIMGAFVAATQSATIWQAAAGWILMAHYLVFALLYGVMLASRPAKAQA
jgi:hypothetical protein